MFNDIDSGVVVGNPQKNTADTAPRMVDAGFAPVASSFSVSTQLAGTFFPMVGVAEDYIELYRSADEFG